MNKKIDQLYEDKLSGIINVDDFERMYISTLDRKLDNLELKEAFKLGAREAYVFFKEQNMLKI